MKDERPEAAQQDERYLTNEKRLTIFRVLFFATFCIDIATHVGKARLYDSARVDVPHFRFMHLLPAVTPERVVVLWVLQSYAAFHAVFNLQMRWTLPLMAVLNFYTYFCSRLDSYQHHYMLWWLLVILSAVDWKRPRAWTFRLALVQASVVYFFAAVSKLEYLDRVHLLLPMQMNVRWLHLPVMYVQRTLGLNNDLAIWWLLGLSVLLLELFLAAGIHVRDERVRSLVWMLGVSFHLMAHMALHIRAFSLYMFALYVLVAPSWLIKGAWLLRPPALWRGSKEAFFWIFGAILSPDDDEEEAYEQQQPPVPSPSQNGSKSSKRRKKQQQKQKAKQQQTFRKIETTEGEIFYLPVQAARDEDQGYDDESEENDDEGWFSLLSSDKQQQQQQQDGRPSWKKFRKPAHLRKQEKAGCCLRCGIWVVVTLLCTVPFAPGWLTFLIWVLMTFFVCMRPRKVTRLRHMVFGYTADNRYGWYIAVPAFLLSISWAHSALYEHAFPFHRNVTFWMAIYWLLCAVRTRDSRTPYLMAHMAETFVLALMSKELKFAHRLSL